MSKDNCCTDDTCSDDCCSDETCSCECCCTGADNGVSVKVNVEVAKIVKYICMTCVMIIGIIFCSKCCRKKFTECFCKNVAE